MQCDTTQASHKLTPNEREFLTAYNQLDAEGQAMARAALSLLTTGKGSPQDVETLRRWADKNPAHTHPLLRDLLNGAQA